MFQVSYNLVFMALVSAGAGSGSVMDRRAAWYIADIAEQIAARFAVPLCVLSQSCVDFNGYMLN